MKILLIDDDPYWSNGLIRSLRFENWDVHYATSPSEGVRILREASALSRPFDVILLDVMMPADTETPEARHRGGHGTGLSLLRRIQSMGPGNTKIILLTARQDIEASEYEGMAIAYLRKNQPTLTVIAAIRDLELNRQ